MPDVKKHTRFREYFFKWRTPKEAEAELPYMDIVISISNYVDEHDFPTIKAELVDINSPKVKQLKQHSSHASFAGTFGTCLYGKVVLEDYVKEGIDTDEKTILNAIRNSLENLYNTPLSNTSDNLFKLINNTTCWLTDYALQSKNLPNAKALCLSLYTILKLMRIKLDSLGALNRATAQMYGIDVIPIQNDLSRLSKKTSKTLTDLELMINPTTSILLTKKPIALPLTLDRHYNAQCLAILGQLDSPLSAKFLRIKEQLTAANGDLSVLLDKKSNQLCIEKQIDQVGTLVQAVDENEKNIIHRKYALDLIRDNQADFDLLFNHMSEDEKADWLTRIEKLSNPGFKQNVATRAEYLLALPFAAIFRRFMSTETQKKITDQLPVTFDTECKILLRAMAQRQMTQWFDTDLPRYKQEIEELITEMSREHPPLKPLLFHATTYELQKLRTKNQLIIEVLHDYERIGQHIRHNQEKLKEIGTLSTLTEAFINKHDGFAVWLSLILAKIFAFFETKTAKQVKAAKAIKAELGQLKDDYHAALDVDKLTIRSNPDVNHDIKEKIISEFTIIPTPKREPSRVPIKVIAPTFNLVSTLFHKIPKASPLFAKDDTSGFKPSPI